MMDKQCLRCDDAFHVPFKKREQKFCSRHCSTAYNNKFRNYDHMKGDSNPAKRPDIREKISKKMLGRDAYWMFGANNINYGGLKEETILKLSIAHKGLMKGDKHWNWSGGTSPYDDEFSEVLKTKIRKRDGFSCQICHKNGFDVHHLDYDKHNCEESNLLTLCRSCHMKTNYNRETWIVYFGVAA